LDLPTVLSQLSQSDTLFDNYGGGVEHHL